MPLRQLSLRLYGWSTGRNPHSANVWWKKGLSTFTRKTEAQSRVQSRRLRLHLLFTSDCSWGQAFEWTIFWLDKCLVLPPRHLVIPVLPVKFASKLLFPNCKTCVDMKHSKTFEKLFPGAECQHNDYLKRIFWGTLVTKELRLALLKGYCIVDVSEVWSWKEEKRFKELFKGYINTFLKLKTEASGWPLWDCEVDIEDQLCHH